MYKKKIDQIMNIAEGNLDSDTLNLKEKRLAVTCGPYMVTKHDSVAMFYVTLNIDQDQMLHNCMLDS